MPEIIINLVGVSIETGLLAYIYQSFFLQDRIITRRKQVGFYLILGSILFTVSYLDLTTTERMGCTLLIALLPGLFYQNNLATKLFIGILFWSIQISCEFLAWTLLTIITQNLHEPLDGHAIDNYIQGVFLSKSIAIFIIYYIAAFRKNNRFYGKKRLLCAFLIVPVITTISINQLAYATALMQTESAHNLFLIVTIFLIMANVILMYLFSKQMEHEMTKRELEVATIKSTLQEQYYQQLIQRDLKVSRMNHDMKNHLAFIKYHLDNAEAEKAKKYLEELTGYIQASKLIYSRNATIDAVLNMKMVEASEAGAKLTVDISKNFGELSIEDLDLVIILCNCLDNAIEASQKIKDGNPEIKLALSKNETGIALMLENPMEQEVDLDNLKSKKTEIGHGYGLKNVRDIVEKYNGILQIETENRKFRIKIFLFEV